MYEKNHSNPIRYSIERIITLSNRKLDDVVNVDAYDYMPCYLWYDCPVYNEFGEEIVKLRGDTIYLNQNSNSLIRDLYHELGHVVSRFCNLVGNAHNGYQGEWEKINKKLIAEISEQRHWSSYLNLFSLSQKNFKSNAASEVWAELFMMWHLYPDCEEAGLLNGAMESLQNRELCKTINNLSLELALPHSGTTVDLY